VKRVIARAGSIDVGQLAELLLFYETVQLSMDESRLEGYIRTLGVDSFMELVTTGLIRLVFLENGLGIQTDQTSHGQIHTPTDYTIHKSTDSPNVLSYDESAERAFERVTGQRGRSRRLANRLSPFVTRELHQQATIEAFRSDMSDREYVTAAVGALLRAYVPEFTTSDVAFEVRPEGGGFAVDTNLDFESINAIYHRRTPSEHSTLTSAFLMSHMLNVRSDLSFGAKYDSELAIDNGHSEIHKVRTSILVDRYLRTRGQANRFQTIVLDDGRNIAGAINSRTRSFAEFLEILRTATQFKKWLARTNPDVELVKQYFEEVTKPSWIDKLPRKTFRWAIFSAAGLAVDAALGGFSGLVTGLALSAGDEFLLEKLLEGWRPNQFVNDILTPFVKRSDTP
jgi:hypothetical protein